MKFTSQLVAFALSVVTVVQASPSINARDPIPAYCNKVISTCAAAPDALTNPWKTNACLLAATCFTTPDGSGGVDSFLAAIAKTKNVSKAPKSLDIPRVSQAVFNSISGDDQVIRILDWIDAFAAELSKSNGPWTDPRAFESNYQRFAVWTGFCKINEGVPLMNFADFFQYSSTVISTGCH